MNISLRKHSVIKMGLVLILATQALRAAPLIHSVSRSADQVGKYARLELTVDLTATFTNAYDPNDIDLWAEFTSPTQKPWRVNGFYDGTQWKIRFAANETGNWSYAVKAKDASGEGEAAAAAFACVTSTNHGWIKVAANHRYLAYDDGTSFYGVGACYPWSATLSGFDEMKRLGFNVYVYWNGTYDRDGGNNLIESMASGLGHYDQAKCTRIDNLINWSEARGLGMILVIWPHDYLCENMGSWPAKWSQNPYHTITTSAAFYGDTNAWAYQEKMYRYIIARWGYSPGLASWQTVDEISGTSGWKTPAVANEWTAKMADFFHANDPFQHPSNASHGDYWPEGNRVNDLSNTEIYNDYSTGNIVANIHRLWNGNVKPCIMGETGADRNGETAHRKLWAGLASGISITPLLWSCNQGWSDSISAQYSPFEKFITGIDFAGLTAPALAQVQVPGASAYGIKSEQLNFGWITGDISGKSLNVTALANGAYRVEWWDCASGAVLTNSLATVTNGSLSALIPRTTQPDLAYKIKADRQ